MADATEAFDHFADFLPEPLLLVSKNGTIRAVNTNGRANLLVGGSDVIGRNLSDFFGEAPEKIDDYLRMCARSREPLPGSLRLRKRDAGGDSDFRCAGWALTPHDAGLILLRLTPKAPAVSRFLSLNTRIQQLSQEVSLRLQAEQSAESQREMLRVTLSSIGDAVVTTDLEGRVTFMNPVAEAHTGWELHEATGRPLAEVFVIRNEQTGQLVESPVDRVLQTGHIVGLANHTVLIRKDNTQLPIDDSGAPIRDADGKLIGVVLVFHEIGERRRLERELGRQADALRQADRRKDEFLAMLAHELRNPLAPLHNCVQMLRNCEQNPVCIGQLADMMERQTRQLTRLVDDLLDISRITRGAIRLERQPTSVSAVMQHAVETVRSLIEKREHKLNISFPADSLIVDGDLARLSQVFCNLLANAAKFMDAGGLITFSGEAVDGSAVLKVRDEGIGLSTDLLPYVFDLFSQGDRGLDREHGGLGIGLTLVKTMVTMHGGEVSAFSEGPGKGSEFTVRLPLARAPIPVAGERPAPKKRLRRRVLIVDDNVDAAESLALLLNHYGCETRTVYEGPSAVRVAQSDRMDVILLDIGLPGMDGFEVARQLRRSPEPNPAIIIAVSGYGSQLDRERAKKAGFDHHLAKPVDLEELLDLFDQGNAG